MRPPAVATAAATTLLAAASIAILSPDPVAAFQLVPKRRATLPTTPQSAHVSATSPSQDKGHVAAVLPFRRGRSSASPLQSTASTGTVGEGGGGGNAGKENGATSRLRRAWLALTDLPSDGTAAKTAAATLATILAYYINNHLGHGPVVGSSVVAFGAAVALGPSRPAMQLAAMCGSFAGMARTAVIPSPAAACLLGLVCSYVIRLFDKKSWLVGKGGRLGFIAQCACTSTFVVLRYGMRALPGPVRRVMESVFGEVVAPAALADFSLYETMSLGKVVSTELPQMMLYVILGAYFMRAWKAYAARLPAGSDRIATPTAAVGATGLVAALLCPEAVGPGPAFVGSFVAMSAPAVLPDRSALALASALAAVGQVSLTGVMLGGWGGKMGTSALMGVLGYRLFRREAKDDVDVKSA